jgi:diguanylate cyclase (GGDEF)-like protein/PAS domain S-box-containing protein
MSPEKDRYHALVDSLPDAFAYHEIALDGEGKPVDYIFLAVNPAFEKMTGLNRDKITGKRVTEVCPGIRESAFDWIGIYGRVALTGESARFAQYFEPLGRWYAVTAYRDEPGFFAAVFRDITAEKRSEEALERSRQEKTLILEHLVELVVYLDRDMNIIWANPAAGDSVGMSPAKLVGQKCYQVWHRRNSPCENCPVVLGMETGRVQSGEITSPDGRCWRITASPVRDETGAIAGVVETALEITEQKRYEAALQEAHRRLEEIIEFLPDATFVIDCAGKVIAWNKSMEEMTGIPKAEMIGRGDYDYALPFYGKRRPILIDLALMPSSEFEKYKQEYEVIAWRGDTLYSETYVPKTYGGRGAYLWASAAKLRDAAGNVIGAIETIRNITERKRFEEQLKYYSLHDQLTGLYNRALFEEELKRLGGGREYPVTIISADLDNLKLINDTLGHDKGDLLLRAAAEVMKKSLRASDILARVGGDEFVVILPRTGAETVNEILKRISSHISSHNRQNPQLPLSISLGWSTAEDESKLLEDVYGEADDLMYRDKFRKGVDTKVQTTKTLLLALGERDFLTAGHAQRLATLSRKVGEKLNLSPKKLSGLVLLSQVHDLGKVGLPDRIVFIKGPLSEAEWEIMRRHPEKGYRIALSSTDLFRIADLILKHHERWDGGGYPLGLAGEEIPVECRIMAVVDAFDAMTSERPYRGARSREEAIGELKKCAGSQFDPKVVDAFFSVLEQEDGGTWGQVPCPGTS